MQNVVVADRSLPDALANEINAMPGVQAARVVDDGRGRLVEIHVVFGGNKSAKNIVRDIETLAQAKFGIQIDRRIVSIVHMGEGAQAFRPQDGVRLSSLSWTTAGAQSTCRVELSTKRGSVQGEASGPSTTGGRLRLTAQAVAGALANSLAEPATDANSWTAEQQASHSTAVEVSDVKLTEVGARTVAVALLVIISGGAEQTLVGSALVRSEDTEAVARAVLSAWSSRTSE